MAFKRLKSLVLAFALAAGAGGLAASAQAQTAGQKPIVTVSSNDYVRDNYVAPEVLEAVSRLPLNTAYPRTGVGFTSARVDQTGENVGVEYCLTGGQKTPVRVYNLDDGNAAYQWRQAISNAVVNETRLASQENSRIFFRPAPVRVVAPTYVYVRPVQPVIFVGPMHNSWHRHNVRYIDHHRNDFHRNDFNRGHRGNGHRHR